MSLPQLKYLKPRHEAIMEWLLANPERSLLECSRTFSVTQAWLSCIIHSDIFIARYQKLLGDYHDERIKPLRDKIIGIAHSSLDNLAQTVDNIVDPEVNLDIATKMLRAVGYGIPKMAAPSVVNNTLVQITSVSPEEIQRAREAHRAFQARLAGPPQAQVVVGEAGNEVTDLAIPHG